MQIVANGIGIELDDQGSPSGDPLILIMGLGMQLVAWPQPFVDLLVARGFRVLRLDNRDIGLSQSFDHMGVPNMALAGLRYTLRLPVPTVYGIADMAQDVLGVMDALGIQSAHICGASMGGMIAQHLAAKAPGRVKSLTLIMTTSGSRKLPQPSLRVKGALMSRPAGKDVGAVVAHLEKLLALIGSPSFPPEPAALKDRLQSMVHRAWRPAGTARQLVAVVADGDRSPLLARIQAPTLVIHGAADPLVPVAAGHELASRIAGAQADIIPGMGHDLPAQLFARLADGIATNASRAR